LPRLPIKCLAISWLFTPFFQISQTQPSTKHLAPRLASQSMSASVKTTTFFVLFALIFSKIKFHASVPRSALAASFVPKM
jgi:hypothetical protein